MLNKTFVVAGIVGALGFGSVACAESNRQTVTYVGGHNAVNLVQVKPRGERTTPYALTGEREVKRANRYEPVQVGQRFAGLRQVD